MELVDVKNDIFIDHEESARNFMILGLAFNIVQWLNFIGNYLPLIRSQNVHHFQKLIDYFSRFEKGMNEVTGPRIKLNAMMQFDEIRDQTLNLWYALTLRSAFAFRSMRSHDF